MFLNKKFRETLIQSMFLLPDSMESDSTSVTLPVRSGLVLHHLYERGRIFSHLSRTVAQKILMCEMAGKFLMVTKKGNEKIALA